jgi:hypothetical protein
VSEVVNKAPSIDVISLDAIDTTNPLRVEVERPIMEEAPEWLEHDVDVVEEEGNRRRMFHF